MLYFIIIDSEIYFNASNIYSGTFYYKLNYTVGF